MAHHRKDDGHTEHLIALNFWFHKNARKKPGVVKRLLLFSSFFNLFFLFLPEINFGDGLT